MTKSFEELKDVKEDTLGQYYLINYYQVNVSFHKLLLKGLYLALEVSYVLGHKR